MKWKMLLSIQIEEEKLVLNRNANKFVGGKDKNIQRTKKKMQENIHTKRGSRRKKS